jgi:hypothetical protein
MAEFKKIKEIPTTLKKGKGKNEEVYTHYVSLKILKVAKESKAQVKDHFKKIIIVNHILDGEKIYSLYIIKKD